MALSAAFVRRAGWGVGDQALSSLTNLGLGLAVARSVSTADFGAFSLAFATYLLIMGLVRAVASQPLSIRYATCGEDQWRDGVRRSVGAALAIGLGTGAVCLFVGLNSEGAFAAAFTALGITLPGLMVQDCWRFAFFAKGDERAAFFNDFVWAALLFPALVVLMNDGNAAVFWDTLVWGASATGAAVFGMYQARAIPQLSGVRSWWSEHRDIVPAYIGEFGATAGASQIGLFAISGVASLATVGALRAADIVMGPVRSLFQGVRQVAQPESVRLLAAGRNLVKACAVLSAGLAAIALTVGMALAFMPDAIGEMLLHETWHAAEEVLLPLTVSIAAAGALVGAQMGLHALVAVGRSLRSRIVLSIMLVGFKVIGAYFGGAVGAATGGAIAMWAGAAMWWWQFLKASTDYRAEAASELTST